MINDEFEQWQAAQWSDVPVQYPPGLAETTGAAS